MANEITGVVLALSEVQTVASKTAGKDPIRKRELLIDCTRYDPYTGKRSEYENTPSLEFGGKSLEKLEALHVAKGDIVTIRFDIQGTAYKDQQGKQRVFTAVRPYDILLARRGENIANHQPTGQQPTSAPPFPASATPFPPSDDDPSFR